MEFFKPAKVTAVHPESNRVDIILLGDGTQLNGVQCMSPIASTRSGRVDLPTVSRSGDEDMIFSDELDLVALVGFLGEDTPFVFGFLYPDGCQMLFKEGDRMVYRHSSDLYFSVDSAGNAELAHPSGSYMRIGETAAHEDLTGLDFNEKWKIDRNTTTKPYFRMVAANGGTEQASIEMSPTGDISMTALGTVTQNITGDVNQTVGGAMTSNISGDATITTPLAKVNGDAEVTGNVTLNSNTVPEPIVTTASVCAFTGGPHPAGSLTCKAGGG